MLNYPNDIKNIYHLPTLPVPDQKETMLKFLQWVEPLVSKKEYLEAQNLVEDFLTQPMAKKLHQRLVDKAKGLNSNWLIDWWLNDAYLASRGPVAPEINAVFLMDTPSIQTAPATDRIAATFYATAKMYLDFKKQGVPDIKVGKRRYSLDQLHGLYASLRIPKIDEDEYYIYSGMSTHGALLFRNRLFNIPLIKEDQVLPYEQIKAAVSSVVTSSIDVRSVNANFVSLACDRNKAAELQKELMEDTENQQAHQQIKDSILTICYDEVTIDNVPDRMRNAYHNYQTINRWHGKGHQLVFTDDAPVAIMSDHTFIDGGTQGYYASELNKQLEQLDLNATTNQKIPVQEIEFNITTEQEEALKHIAREHKEYVDDLSIRLLETPYLTREVLRNAGILSADGFFHLALQLAQKRTFDALYNTYVAVDMRTFFKGRTECLRPISKESKTFIEKFNKGDRSKEVHQQMIEALIEYYQRSKDCQAGHGVNRYLFGLQQAYKELSAKEQQENPMPLFNSQAFQVIQSSPLSTSSVLLPYIDKLGFQPVESDGFGMGYVVGENSYVLASSFKKDEEIMDQLLTRLEESIQELMAFASEIAKETN